MVLVASAFYEAESALEGRASAEYSRAQCANRGRALVLPMLEGKTVLIVEDDFLIAQLLGDMLEDIGCTSVSTAGSVAQATEALKTKPDLVILDLNLDGESAIPIAMRLPSSLPQSSGERSPA